MASLIPGYEYDIFISYRQKDNKGDRWVSEFVEALKTELESTFKEEISVYFDINPHDGLLETHDVDASLKDKLKCLVFIPIISRTYCDPKSFAWEHEFKAFIEQASSDQFGLKVKLPNGNVANRVLPIRIHDLDIADIKECELVLGGVLRGVEFIYKEPGINKPLSPEDDEKKNLNLTKYRLQINKTANAVKEIIAGLKTGPVGSGSEKIQFKVADKEVNIEKNIEEHDKSVKSKVFKLLSGLLITASLIIFAILAYPKIFRHDKLEDLRSSDGRISVAVMPFQNMTTDTIWNVWQDGIQELLTTSLSNEEELKVRQAESINRLISSEGFVNFATLTPSAAGKISRKLDANVFISGNIIKADSFLWLNAQLSDSRSGDVLRSFRIEGTKGKIIPLIDSLSKMIRNYLITSKLQKSAYFDYQFYSLVSANDIEAYKLLIKQSKAVMEGDLKTANNYNFKALAIDSNYIPAKLNLVGNYIDQGLYGEAKKWLLQVYEKRDQIPLQYKLFINFQHAYLFETPYEQIKYLKQLQEFDNQNPETYLELGWAYHKILQFDKAISNYEKSLEIYKRWNLKPFWSANYTFLGELYHKTDQYNKERKLYKKAEHDIPDNYRLIYRQIVLALTQKKTNIANEYIEKYKSLLKENSASEADIITNIGRIYFEAEIFDKAEEYLRQALSLDPDKPEKLNTIGWFLIETDRNIIEGLEFVGKALELSPDNYEYLNTKGWGIYKQKKYSEALNILQKSWDLRMKNAIYDHDAFLHLEAAKKAVANQKNN